MRVWATRDKANNPHDARGFVGIGFPDICVVWLEKPINTEGVWHSDPFSTSLGFDMKVADFKKKFGFTLRRGSYKECELELKVL